MSGTTLANQRVLATTQRQASTPGLLVPLVGTGLLMAMYLLLRPYGDAADQVPEVRAGAFASSRWVVSHLAGALAIVSFTRFALRLSDAHPASRAACLARWSGIGGAVMVLPYFGAETFALHVLGKLALLGNVALLDVGEQIRNLPAAVATFGFGLALLAISGVAAAFAWRRVSGSLAAWPVGLGVALLLPQFYLPSPGRMAFGLFYLAAAGILATSIMRCRERE